MLIKIRNFEESYGGRKIHNIKVRDLKSFYYISKNTNDDVIIMLNDIGYIRKKDYKVLKLYEKEFIQLKNKAIKNICENICHNLDKFNNIVLNNDIVNKNDNELLNLLLNGKLHSNNRHDIINFTDEVEIIKFIDNYNDFSTENYQKSIFRLNSINQKIDLYKDILSEIHSIKYSDIMK